MATSIKGQYKGALRNELLHEQSGTAITTDAPLDNQGKGESFSPTDLVAAALGSCMITIIGIRAKARKIKIGEPSYSIKKHMGSNPRKISRIEIEIIFQEELNEEDKTYLEQEAKKCPVALSIADTIEQNISFIYK